MKRTFIYTSKMILAASVLAAVSCKRAEFKEEAANAVLGDEASAAVIAGDYSVTPPLIKKLAGFEGLQVNSLIGSDDVLALSPTYVFVLVVLAMQPMPVMYCL